MAELCLKVQDLRKEYRSERRKVSAVDQVSFSLHYGETLGIAGESGSGKTTVARMLTQIERPDGGSILLCGKPLEQSGRRQVQMVFQNAPNSFSPRKTIGDTICDSVRNFRLAADKKEGRKLIERYMDMVGLEPSLYDRYPGQLSGGQCQRAAIVRAVIPNPDLLILDEATSALDVLVQKKIMELLSDIRKKMNMGMIFISHDLALLGSFCDRLLIMKDGRTVEEGVTDSILLNPQKEYTKKLIQSVL